MSDPKPGGRYYAHATPEHTRPRDRQELIDAQGYVDSVITTADCPGWLGGPVWHGWALREAFLAGITWAQGKGAE